MRFCGNKPVRAEVLVLRLRDSWCLNFDIMMPAQ